MKKLFFSIGIFTLAMLIFASCSNQKKNVKGGFSVAVNISDLKPATQILLQKRQDGQWVKLDSTTLKDGKGTLYGKIKSPELYYLTIKKFNVFIPMWLENSKITVSATLKSLRKPTIKGSKTQDEFEAYEDSIKPFQQKEMEIAQKYRVASFEKKQGAMEEAKLNYDKVEDQRMNYMIGYVKRHNKSVISPYLVLRNSFGLSLGQLDTLTSSFDPSLAQNSYVQFLKKRVATLEKVAPGHHFINFTLDNPAGKPVSLSSVVDNNKYTLVDFWASWCGPCRAENPNVVAAYKKFHKKGFTVFGVSLDKDHASWVKAIKKDGLVWTQVSDLKFWQSAAGKLYGVESIPHNVLINKKGIIIAQNLRGDALQKELKKLLK